MCHKLKYTPDGLIDFTDRGHLPKGIHEITIEEIEQYYCFSPKRRFLVQGLKQMLKDLKDVGCKSFYLDGSFVTNKLEPGDYDACWELSEEINLDKLKTEYPELLIFRYPRAEQKIKYFGEAFIANGTAFSDGQNHITYKDFFQKDKDGVQKGILLIKL